jgi:hypothetical protein
MLEMEAFISEPLLTSAQSPGAYEMLLHPILSFDQPLAPEMR